MPQLTLCLANSRVLQPSSTVIGTSNSGGLVEIQTSAPHGLLTSDIIQAAGIGGTLSGNGQFLITKVDSTHFTLNNSSYSGAFTAGGEIYHLGWSPGSLLVDNSIFPAVPDFTLTTRVEAVSPGSNIRACFQDAVDASFVTAEPLVATQAGANGGTFDAEGTVFTWKRENAPDARFGVSGAHLRLLIYVSGGAFSNSQVSAWLNY